MKSSSSFAAAAAVVTLAAVISTSDAATVAAKSCTQDERQLMNSLLQQDKNPFQACAARARGDITVLATSRLCPLSECKVWLEYMAETAPDCDYDDTNYRTAFIAKAESCDAAIGSGSMSDDADTSPAPAGNSTATAPTPSSTTNAPTPSSTTKAPSTDSGNSTSHKASADNTSTPSPSTGSSSPLSRSMNDDSNTTTAPTPAPSSGAAALSVVASLSAVVLSVAALMF